MGRHAQVGLVAAVAIVAGVLVAANVSGTSPARDERVAQTGSPLLGPDAPAPEALPGVIVFRAGACESGWIDLAAAKVHRDEADPNCVSRGLRSREAASVATLPIDPVGQNLAEADLSAALAEGTTLLGVVGYDLTAMGLAGVVVATRAPERLSHVLQIWRDSMLERSIELAGFRPDAVRLAGDFGLSGRVVLLSPNAHELVMTSDPGSSRVTLIDLTSGERALLPAQLALDWSPDGRWLATSSGDEILVHGASRTEHVYALDVAVSEISWSPAIETP